MSQINITLNYQEALDLFSKDRNEAFAILIQKTLNAVLSAESEEQGRVSNRRRVTPITSNTNSTTWVEG